VLSLTRLTDADYLLNQVAAGVEDYYTGGGEAPGVWHGAWAGELGLEGVVEADALRSLLDGFDPVNGDHLLEGRPERTIKAFDATFSAPKSASLLWAFGSPEVSAAAAIAHVEAVGAALEVLGQKTAVARQQRAGVRDRVATRGLAVASFVHRTSREGDPQLHTHCVIPNLVERDDGSHVALDAGPLWEWKKAVGSIYQEELRTRLTRRLGVAWTADRNGTREIVGVSPEQLRRFSKRTVAIEAHVAGLAVDHADRAARMRAAEAASLATRPAKDATMTPERLRGRWEAEAAEVGLATGEALAALVSGRTVERGEVDVEALFAHLVDPEVGLCARESRFCEADVVAAVAAWGGGRLERANVLGLARSFLGSELVVRLLDPDPARPGSPRWSTVEHLAVERRVLDGLDRLAATPAAAIGPALVEGALVGAGLGEDQAAAVRVLCGAGGALRVLAAPAGFGKTTTLHAAAAAQAAAGRHVVGLAATNRAVAELRDVGLEAMTLARFRLDAAEAGLPPGLILVLDETSQVATRDVAWLLDAIEAVPGVQLWCVGDHHQARAVRAGGLAHELDRLAAHGAVPCAVLAVNRRQRDPAERAALAAFRAGDVAESQAIRTEAGWEHDAGTPTATRDALADAFVADVASVGGERVVALAVAHADCEDLADRIRARLIDDGAIGGTALHGPGWGHEPRVDQAGVGSLLHTTVRLDGRRLHNGTALTVTGVSDAGLAVAGPAGHGHHVIPREVVEGRRRDGTPNVSHAWARTVDGAQGGTWHQVHLLGTTALDRYTGYVGQSRGRAATHTWNVRPLVAVDHGGRLADDRTAADTVLSALQRQPDGGFAARHDPYAPDRELRAERDAHLGVLARRPPDVGPALANATRALAAARHDEQHAADTRARALDDLAAVGPVARLRRDGRARVARLDQRIRDAQARQADAAARVAATRHTVDRLEHVHAARQVFDDEHAWRLARVGELNDRLARHWTHAVLGALRQGDPLAYGIDRLRSAYRTTIAQLRGIDQRIGPDRGDALHRAELDAAHRERQHAYVQRERDAARAELDRLHRRPGRRHRDAIAAATARLHAADAAVSNAAARLQEATACVERERAADAARALALDETADTRAALRVDARHLLDALDTTRPQRIRDAARGDTGYRDLREALGPPPASLTGMAAWCGIAYRIETYRDHHGNDRASAVDDAVTGILGSRPDTPRGRDQWDQLASLIRAASNIIKHAQASELDIDEPRRLDDPRSWKHALERSIEASGAVRERSHRADAGLEL
jgi:conjugative relaxase-like TrwC/TraI family protein